MSRWRPKGTPPPPPRVPRQSARSSATTSRSFKAEIARSSSAHNRRCRGRATALSGGGQRQARGRPAWERERARRTLAKTLSLHFSRIPVHADLMPAEVIGAPTSSWRPRHRQAQVRSSAGPIFAQVDSRRRKFNRATPDPVGLSKPAERRLVTVAARPTSSKPVPGPRPQNHRSRRAPHPPESPAGKASSSR